MHARLRAAAGLAALGAAVAIPYPPEQCGSAAYQCVYQATGSDGLPYTWDLRSLCRAPGAEYTVLSADGGSNFIFNVCGIVGGQQNGAKGATYCSPQDKDGGAKVAMYTRGAVMQEFIPPIQPTGQCQDLECKAALALDPTTQCSVTVPCTNNCEVVAHFTAPMFALRSTALDVNAGINLSFTGVPWYPNDFFPCDGQDPDTGLQTERQVTMTFRCNPGIVGTLANIVITEVAACNYLITADTAAACASAVPSASTTPSTTPAPSFSSTPSATPTPAAPAALATGVSPGSVAAASVGGVSLALGLTAMGLAAWWVRAPGRFAPLLPEGGGGSRGPTGGFGSGSPGGYGSARGGHGYEAYGMQDQAAAGSATGYSDVPPQLQQQAQSRQGAYHQPAYQQPAYQQAGSEHHSQSGMQHYGQPRAQLSTSFMTTSYR